MQLETMFSPLPESAISISFYVYLKVHGAGLTKAHELE